MIRTPAAVITMMLTLAALAPAALAQSVPLPTPAPHTRTGSVPPPPSAIHQARPGAGPGGIIAATPQQAPVMRPAIQVAARPAAPGALDDRQRALVDRISMYLSSMQSLVGDFVQVGPDGRRTQGQFYIQKPGKVRFEYDPPTPIAIIADGESVVVRDRKLATQDLYPLSQTPLRFLLSDRIDLMRDTKLVGVYADEVFATVVIEERQPVIGTSRLMMMFGAKDLQLRQWTVTDAQGYDTTVAVYNLDSTKRPDPNLFRIDYTRNLQ
jgi:outer membrane lipoprotein-sorting protein